MQDVGGILSQSGPGLGPHFLLGHVAPEHGWSGPGHRRKLMGILNPPRAQGGYTLCPFRYQFTNAEAGPETGRLSQGSPAAVKMVPRASSLLVLSSHSPVVYPIIQASSAGPGIQGRGSPTQGMARLSLTLPQAGVSLGSQLIPCSIAVYKPVLKGQGVSSPSTRPLGPECLHSNPISATGQQVAWMTQLCLSFSKMGVIIPAGKVLIRIQ